MKKKIIVMVLLIAMVFVIPVSAVSTRVTAVLPALTFNGTTATCSVMITGDYTSDKIDATVELWQGSKRLKEWTASGYGVVEVKKTATVEKNKSYTLKVKYSINYTQKTPVSISRTND